MPAKSVAQQHAAGADLARVRAGKKPRTFKGMSEEKLKHTASTSTKGLPKRAHQRAAAARLSKRQGGGY